MKFTSFVLPVLLQSILLYVTIPVSLDLTKDEKAILDKFRSAVIDSITEDYMREDIFLVNWLRARNFDINQAKEMLFVNLKFRQQNNMSRIHDENWSDMQEDYPYSIDSVDKTGRPICAIKFSEWNIRQAVLTGKRQRLIRYFFKILDESTSKVRAFQKEGKEVTQWVWLFDMEGYNLVNQGCISCLSVYLAFTTLFESYFPGNINSIILINTPSIFETILRITRPLMSQSTRDTLYVLGNKQQWSAYLMERIDADNLEGVFGGTKS